MRAAHDYVLAALMVTDIFGKGTDLLVAGDPGRWSGRSTSRSPMESLHLPGVMSRKKQVAPPLLGAFD